MIKKKHLLQLAGYIAHDHLSFQDLYQPFNYLCLYYKHSINTHSIAAAYHESADKQLAYLESDHQATARQLGCYTPAE